jgi:hypothetical protein
MLQNLTKSAVLQQGPNLPIRQTIQAPPAFVRAMITPFSGSAVKGAVL